MSFLGLINYCRNWVPNYAEIMVSLQKLMYDNILKMNSPVTWTQEADTAFCNIKQVLVSSTALELPDYSKPFLQMVDCKGNLLTSVLVQQHGDKMKPVAYFSSKLNDVACVLPHCVRTPIAASMAVEVSEVDKVILKEMQQRRLEPEKELWNKHNAKLLNSPRR
uniref:Reverse transcriptase/retrotransposon-derived protein RNase H-like domain-containing protein n=1 Tax=Oryzias sinensis TaxID=183150 RepID=A0A8C7YC33_9TELE